MAFLTTKPEPGERGLKGRVDVNCLPVISPPSRVYFHYDVAFDESVKSHRARWQLVDRVRIQNPQAFPTFPLFDGKKNIFSSTQLALPNDVSGTFSVSMEGGRKQYGVTLTLVARIYPQHLRNLASNASLEEKNQRLTAITLLNVLVRMGPATSAGALLKGRSFFTERGRQLSQDGTLEFWRGFYQSIRPSASGLVLNVDTAVALVYPSVNLLEAITKWLRRSPDELKRVILRGQLHERKRVERDIKRYLKGIRVKFSHRPTAASRVVDKFIWEAPATFTFDNNELGKEQSVADYFAGMGHRLNYPSVPIMVSFGSAALPIELLKIESGQFYRGAMPENVQAELLKFATHRPQERLNMLRDAYRDLRYNDSKYLRDAGMRIDENHLSIEARVLTPPVLELYQRKIEWNSRDEDRTKGAWNMKDKVLYRASRFLHLAVVDAANAHGPRLGDVIHQMKGILYQIGIRFEKTSTHVLSPFDLQQNLDRLRSEIRNQNPAITNPTDVLVLVLVQDSAKAVREYVKWWGDVKRGIPTQVVKASKLMGQKGFDQYVRNLGLKINAKCGGLNMVPARPNASIMPPPPPRPSEGSQHVGFTMVCGLDTSHPPSGSSSPTMVGFVYSVDSRGVDYRAEIQVQPPRVEIVSTVGQMMLDALFQFSRTGSRIVTRVVFYRDGVSEGQFEEVANKEIALIYQAFDKMEKAVGVRPKLTFIVVGKKHHIRFFPERRLGDQTGNAVPGTVVDTQITTSDPNLFDFYMCSHGALIGTSRPAHYTVLRDDGGYSADDLQQFSNDLCHVYQIATRSVSIPAPVYYADKVAGRGSILFHTAELDTASLSSDGRTPQEWASLFYHKGTEDKPNIVYPHRATLQRMFWL